MGNAPNWADLFENMRALLKEIMPWVTGGLAGAVLTHVLKRRLDRQRQLRLSVETSTRTLSVPRHEAFKNLQVFYNGQAYDELSYHEFTVENISRHSIDSAQFIIRFSDEPTILDRTIRSKPVKIEIQQNHEGLEYRFAVHELRQDDSVIVHLLVKGASTITWFFRGPDEVDVQPVRLTPA